VPRLTIYPKTHYVTPREVLLAAVDQIKDELRGRLAQLREAGNDVAADLIEGQSELATVDVWIDRKGLVRRTAMTTGFQLAGTAGTSMSMTMDFYDFGAAPKIGVPSELDTFDATELALQGLQGLEGLEGVEGALP